MRENITRDSFVRKLIDTMPEGLVIIDTDGTILAFSNAASVLFGYAEKEVVGRNFRMLLPPARARVHGKAIKSYLESGQPNIVSIERIETGRNKSGQDFPVRLTVGEVTIANKTIFIAYVEDMSAAEEQRRKLRALGSELAHASRVNSVSLLAGAIAHELNQPLTAIRNYVESVAEMAGGVDPVDSQILCEAMTACADETFRASEIIRRLRQFLTSKDTEFASESLSRLVQEALMLALADGEKMGVDIRLNLDMNADVVLVDGIQIQQVIFNLARNALQAMRGRERKQISIASLAKGETVEVIVEDSGPGLDAERELQLVLPFSSGNPNGMGFGLQICQAIVEAHGGKLWATPSRLGGAAIHFTIPRMAVEGTYPP